MATNLNITQNNSNPLVLNISAGEDALGFNLESCVHTFPLEFNLGGLLTLGDNDFNLQQCSLDRLDGDFNLLPCGFEFNGELILDNYGGQSVYSSLTTTKTFSIDINDGQSASSILATTTTFDGDALTGSTLTPSLKTSIPALLELDLSQGQNTEPLELQNNIVFGNIINNAGQGVDDISLLTAEFDALAGFAYAGGYLTPDLYTTPAFEANNSNGQTVDDVDLTIDPISTFIVTFNNGQNSTIELSNPDHFEILYLNGESSVAELDTTVVHEYSTDMHNGQVLDNISISTSNVLFPRANNGESCIIDVTFAEADELSVDFNNGQVLTPNTLAVTYGLEPVAHNGQSAELQDLRYTKTFEVDYSTGQMVAIDELYIHGGDNLEAEGYNGQDIFVQDDILLYQILRPQVIQSSQLFYDGMGGVGGINFCTSSHVTENITDFNASEFDRHAFDECGSKNYIQMDMELRTTPRLSAMAYSGQSMQMYIPQRLLGFGIDDDDPRLYFTPILYIKPAKTFEVDFNNGQSAVEMNSHPDDFLAIHAQSATVDLTVTSFVSFDFGQELDVTVSFDSASWKRAFRVAGNGQSGSMEFEPNLCQRFCKGYLIPTGDNVTFDFANVDFLDCSSYNAYVGEYMTIGLSAEYTLFPDDYYTGQELLSVGRNYEHELNPQVMGHGYGAHWYNGQNFEMLAYHGSSADVDFEKREWNASNGASATLRHLAEATPSLKFVTDKGCLENQYIPLTPDGDYDLTYVQVGACVEFEPYWTRVEGLCVDEYTYKTYFHTEIITGTTGATCSLSTQVNLKGDVITGDTLIPSLATSQDNYGMST